MKLKTILREYGYEKTPIEVFDFFDQSHYSLLDLYPKVIENIDKYSTVEIFFQKVLDKNIKLSEFEEIEEQFSYVIKMMWLYNNVYANVFYDSDSDITKNYYFKKSRQEIGRFSKRILELSKNTELSILVSDLDLLLSLCKIAFRDIATIFFSFSESGIIMLLNGFSAKVLYKSNADLELFKSIINTSKLYFYCPKSDS